MALAARGRRTLEAVFHRPTLANIRWSDIEHLFEAVGAEVAEGAGSRVRIKLGDQVKFLVENMECEGMYLNDKLFSVELPVVVVLTVRETVPGVKGDSVSNMTKVATLETGHDIKVPLFINEGEKIRVDTRTGEYLERA